MAHLDDLLARRANTWAQMQDIMSRSEDEGRPMTAEERASWDAADADLVDLSESIERMQRGAALGEIPAGQAPAVATEPAQRGEYADVFGRWVRRGMNGLSQDERGMLADNFVAEGETRAQSSGTTTTGGYSVPQGFWAKVTDTMKAYGGLLQVANILNTDSGNTIPWPTVDDTGNVGAILSENTQVTGQDLTFGQNSLGAYMYTSKLILASFQFLQDTGIDAEGFIAKKVGQRIGRAVAAHLATGTGTGQPQGVTNFTVGKTGTTGQTTSVIYDDLVDVEHSVDAAYRNAGNCVYVMNDASLKVIRKLKDGQSRPLYDPAVQKGELSTVNGYRVIIDNGMPTMAANAKSIAFGDFSLGLVVRQVNGGQLLRLEERYADYLQVGFLGFGRFDGRIDDASAVRLYQNSAT